MVMMMMMMRFLVCGNPTARTPSQAPTPASVGAGAAACILLCCRRVSGSSAVPRPFLVLLRLLPLAFLNRKMTSGRPGRLAQGWLQGSGLAGVAVVARACAAHACPAAAAVVALNRAAVAKAKVPGPAAAASAA